MCDDHIRVTPAHTTGSLVIVDFGLAVVRVDPVSGDRTIVSDASKGSGPSFDSSVDIALEADLLVMSYGNRYLNP